MNQGQAAQSAMFKANHTGQPRTVFQCGHTDFNEKTPAKVPADGVQFDGCATWLPVYYFTARQSAMQ